MCQVLYIFVDPAITSCTINYAHFKHKKNNNSQAIWPNSSRTRISTQGFKTLPYLPGHSANQSKTMLSTLPPLSPQAPLIFHLTYPTSQDPATTSSAQHPISHILCPIFTSRTVSTSSPSNPFQKPQLTELYPPRLFPHCHTRSRRFCSTCSQAHTSIMSPNGCRRKQT